MARRKPRGQDEAQPSTTLGRDDILSAKDLKTERVAVPEWGKDAAVIVSEFSAEVRDQFWGGVGGGEGKKQNLANIKARLAVLCIVDEKGERIFTDDDAAALGRKNAIALARVWQVAARLNGIGIDVEAAVEKNS